MKSIEVWLCKVLLHPGPVRRPLNVVDLSARSHQATMAKVIAGELGTLPDGCIIEPITAHRTEAEAHAARDAAMAEHPGEDFRVVVTVPL